MIPSILANQVKLGLEDLVRTTANISTPYFAGMVDRFLAGRENFIKGPWVSLDLPFRKSEGLSGEFFPHVPLGFAPHAHQVKAFERLAAPNAKSTIVATGTGSGKTEAFLWPIFDACVKAGSEPGIKAIVIYPMNALAGDQARRIASAVQSIPALSNLRVGIYADKQPIPSSSTMTPDDIITDREEMQRNPPDILLTNYKMLDLLLLRPDDQALWAQNLSSTLKYLVVDELHTFDGAQGTDLALLIRRLKTKLGMSNGHLACIGTSATLGSGGTKDIIQYAIRVFGEDFASDSVVVEDRLTAAEYLAATSLTDLRMPDGQQVSDLMDGIDGTEQASAIVAIADLLLTEPPKGSPASNNWRVALGEHLKGHVLFHELIRATDGKPTSYEMLETHFLERTFLRTLDPDTVRPVIDAIIALVAYARSRPGSRVEPLLNVRTQIWVRELARMVATVDPQTPALLHSDDLNPDVERRSLPLVCCRQCGTTAWLGMQNQRRTELWAEPKALYDGFFEGSDRIRLIYPEPISRQPQAGVVPGSINAKSLAFSPGDPSDDDSDAVPAWLVNPTGFQGKVSSDCPACGSGNSLTIIGLRAAREISSVVSTLFGSLHNGEPSGADIPKLLMFSDSVQDAAQRAGVVENRHAATVLRRDTVQFLDQQRAGETSISDLVTNAPAAYRATIGDESFVATFIPSDMQWMRDYPALLQDDRLPAGSRLPSDVEFRIGWDLFADFTFLSSAGQSLEMTGLAAIHVEIGALQAAAETFASTIKDKLGAEFAVPSNADATHFFIGLLDHMRRHGAANHSYVRQMAYKDMNSFAAAKTMVRDVLPAAMPHPGRNRSARPNLPATSSLKEFEFVGRQTANNWYRAWADRFFLISNVFAGMMYAQVYEHAFECAIKAGLVVKLNVEAPNGATVFALSNDAIFVSRDVSSVACDTCGKLHSVPKSAAPIWAGTPCTKLGCQGQFEISGHHLGSDHLERLYTNGRTHRVVAREHTGILEADDRKRLEQRFINGAHAWDPNTLSATPTLEMGINIGDLSTLILSSVPPEQANYVQRIGRTGRRDGNSLNLTIVNARPHDLQFWKSPEKMIRGEVRSPGVHLGAIAVLKRQVAALTLDRWVSKQPASFDYGKMKAALAAIDTSNQAAFPNTWLNFITSNVDSLTKAFLGLLPADVRSDLSTVQQLSDFVASEQGDGLRYHIADAFRRASRQRESLKSRLKDVQAAIRALKKEQPRPLDFQTKLDEMNRDAGVLKGTITAAVEDVLVLQYLTENGVLPNYAFPEEGVTLQSVIYWRANSDGSPGQPPKIIEYPRPASSALSELAPNAEFYAQGRKARVDQIDLTAADIQQHRICDACTHMELEANVPSHQKNCPKCGSQMWGDTGRKKNLVELRTVIATTDAARASIDDRDDRHVSRYDRDILPDYPDSAISSAFALERQPGAVPFGYEYITSCQFRDINFGPLADAPIGGEVAGSERFSRAFPVCKECGMLQKPRQLGDTGTHTIRCRLASETDPTKYETEVYLFRTFKSEAIRIVVPVIGSAKYDDVKSFVAALDIGLRKHFSGKVDHIRSTLVEQKSQSRSTTVRNLYFYDTVPGGTAYLKQIAHDPAVMENVLKLALGHLQTCSCNSVPGEDGCFQCVRSYRSQFGMGEASRDLAIRMLQEVLQDWKTLKPITSVTNMVQNDIFDSELEARFIDQLKEAVKPDGLLVPVVLPNGRTGFQVRFGANGVRWTIEDHVWAKDRFGIPVDTEIDFLLTPVGIKGASPVAVYLDGWQYHQNRIGSDVEKRVAILRSGKAFVWTLTWEDLEAKAGKPPHFTDLMGAASMSAALPKLPDNGKLAERIRSEMPLQALLSHLREPHQPDRKCSLAAIGMFTTVPVGGGPHAGALPSCLSPSAVSYLSGSTRSGSRQDGGASISFGYSKPAASSGAFDLDTRIVLGLHPSNSQEVKRDWNGFFHLLNTMQFDPGLHLDVEGITTLALPGQQMAVQSLPADVIWDEIKELVDPSALPLVEKLRSLGAPVPVVGLDVMNGDMVVGQVELAWKSQKIGVVLNPISDASWNLITLTVALKDVDALINVIRSA